MRKILFVLAFMAVAVASCKKAETGGTAEKLSVDIEVSDVTSVSASVSYIPSSDALPYIAGHVSKDVLDGSFSDIKHYIDGILSDIMTEEGLTRAEAAASASVRGDSREDLSGLDPETAYVCYAVGIDDAGLYTTDSFVSEFVTAGASDPSEMLEFEISVSSVTAGSVSVSVIPSDNGLPYYWDVMTKEAYDEYNGDIGAYLSAALENLASEEGVPVSVIVPAFQITGKDEDSISGLPADTDMYVYAVGLNADGTCYGTPAAVSFRTAAPGDPAECTFEFSFVDSMDGMEITVTPSDDGVGYFNWVLPVSEYVSDEAIVESVYESLVSVATDNGMSMSQLVSLIAMTGEYTDTYDLEEGEYYAYAYALSSAGKNAGPVFKERFTVDSYASDATVGIENVRWFDGNALADIDSRYDGLRGGAYFLADVVHSDNAYQWYLGLLPGDYTDEASFPDETVYDALMGGGGVLNRETLAFGVQYGTLTVLGFAIDANGVSGAVYRLRADVTEDGATPVSEFNLQSMPEPFAQIYAGEASLSYFGQEDVFGERLMSHRSTGPFFRHLSN
ncbi:MAG: hypothetical protein IAC23_01575 [Bacteroidetes bacterium]|uniref:Lipoprotein n=1 Tax=Candidatus Cryptobacteroides merdavium TaxID=2840769 RepID=A0A9D9EB61_9BACT|nr:hypothetical protein [Candidatus Cryptobacteroides merdavium]